SGQVHRFVRVLFVRTSLATGVGFSSSLFGLAWLLSSSFLVPSSVTRLRWAVRRASKRSPGEGGCNLPAINHWNSVHQHVAHSRRDLRRVLVRRVVDDRVWIE